MERRRENYWQKSQTSSDSGQGASNPSGTQHVETADRKVFARIIGLAGVTSSSGQVAYYWQESQPTTNGVWADDTYGLACTSTNAGRPGATGYAWELNGKDTIPANSIVEVEYLNGQMDARGESWRILLSAAALTAGVDAEELDGTPSYTNRTKFIFDQADGFVLSEPAAGQVRIDIQAASNTQAGVVSTTTQTFAGHKTFSQIRVDDYIDMGGRNTIYENAGGGAETSFEASAGAAPGTFGFRYGSVLKFYDETDANPWSVTNGGGSLDMGGPTSNDFFSVGNARILHNSNPPASAADSGNAGEITWDSGFIYVCVAANTWKRVAIATW